MKKRIKTKFGDAVLCSDGYYKISNSNKKYGGKLLHRLIYTDYYDIVLGSDVIIHHLDGNKRNNDISNLIPMTNSEHIRQHQLGENNNNYGGLSDENKLNLSKSVNTTGYFRVVKHTKKDVNQGFTWSYQYYDETGKRRNISSISLHKLEEKVKSKGLDWIVLDEDKARACMGM